MRDMTRGRAGGTSLGAAIAVAAAAHGVALALLFWWPGRSAPAASATSVEPAGRLEAGQVIDTALLPAVAPAATTGGGGPAATTGGGVAAASAAPLTRTPRSAQRVAVIPSPTLGAASEPVDADAPAAANPSLGAPAATGLPTVGAPPATPAADRGAANRSSDGGRALARYAAEVRRRMESHKRYPRRALASGASGTARVRLTIDARGRLAGSAHLAGSAGDDALDAEALRMARAAAPFPAPPEDAPAPLEIVVPVRFDAR